LGDLHWDVLRKCPVLSIGHHRLYGEYATLKKPFMLMKRCLSSMDYVIQAIIREKMVFRSRPESVLLSENK
jgi:hypothetical protein